LFCSSKCSIFSSNSLIRKAYLIDDSTKFELIDLLSDFFIFIAFKIDFSMGLSAFSSFCYSSFSSCDSSSAFEEVEVALFATFVGLVDVSLATSLEFSEVVAVPS
jgi:hypothetical protein